MELTDCAGSSSALIVIFGGYVADLRPFLLEERIPDGWQPYDRHRMGLTMAEFNMAGLKVELGIEEELPGYFGLSENAGQQKKLD